MELIIGKKYITDVAECTDTATGQKVLIPILPLRHKDPSFGVDEYHYHVDCRFYMSEYVKENLLISNFTTTAPIWENNNLSTRFLFKKVSKARKKYVSLTTGFDMEKLLNPTETTRQRVKLYWKWYRSMIGKSCEGKKCPHYGTDMIDTGKHLVCPMHNLIASKKTLKIIKFKK